MRFHLVLKCCVLPEMWPRTENHLQGSFVDNVIFCRTSLRWVWVLVLSPHSSLCALSSSLVGQSEKMKRTCLVLLCNSQITGVLSPLFWSKIQRTASSEPLQRKLILFQPKPWQIGTKSSLSPDIKRGLKKKKRKRV